MIERGQTREIPPERKTMGDPCISMLFDMSGCGCGRYTGMVLPH
jgi:hypothetical protein